MRAFFFALALACAACTPAPEQSDTTVAPAGRLEVRDAWAAPTPNGVDVSAGYLTIINGGSEADRLIGAESARAGRVEVHEMIMDGAVMQMRPIQALEIGAGETASLAPGGAHLMFYEVTEPFTEGQTVSVRLQFERAGAVDINLPVRRAAAHGAGH
ncbi:MAG: hypothetical protein DCF16_03010 [Alphaproteobacteria bacterium]|nr:MAG: hypothetical protein DCF16_03010 [Alphaproteobacteria bacterium]